MRSSTAPLCALVALVLAAPPLAAEEPPWTFEVGVPFFPGRVGVQVLPMTPELREHFAAPADRGLLVSRVAADRAGAAAGLRVGDVITDVDGEPMRRTFDLVKAVGRAPAGSTLRVGVVREGETRTLPVAPEGEANEWLDPERWDELLQRGMRRGSEELRRALDELQRRFEELERGADEPIEGPHRQI